MRNPIPLRYRTKVRLFSLLLLLYLAVDLLLGTLILKYFDPIGFAKEYPLLVLFVSGIALVWLLKRGKKS